MDLPARPAAAGQRRRSTRARLAHVVCECAGPGERQSAVHNGERRCGPVQRPAEDSAAGELPALRSAPGCLPVCEVGPRPCSRASRTPESASCGASGWPTRVRGRVRGGGTEPSRAHAWASGPEARDFLADGEARARATGDAVLLGRPLGGSGTDIGQTPPPNPHRCGGAYQTGIESRAGSSDGRPGSGRPRRTRRERGGCGRASGFRRRRSAEPRHHRPGDERPHHGAGGEPVLAVDDGAAAEGGRAGLSVTGTSIAGRPRSRLRAVR